MSNDGTKLVLGAAGALAAAALLGRKGSASRGGTTFAVEHVDAHRPAAPAPGYLAEVSATAWGPDNTIDEPSVIHLWLERSDAEKLHRQLGKLLGK